MPIGIMIFFLTFTPMSIAAPGDTSHLAFVQEYMRELGEEEGIRAAAEGNQNHVPANIKVEAYPNLSYIFG